MKRILCGTLCILMLAGCSEKNMTYPKAINTSEVSRTVKLEPPPIDVDYVDVVRYPHRYNGERIRVSGKVYADITASEPIEFRDRAFQPDVLESRVFNIQLPESMKTNRHGFNNENFITVSGLWSSNGYHSRLENTVIETRGDEAQAEVEKYQKLWEEKKLDLAKNINLIDYMEIDQNSEQYKGEYIRISGKLSIEESKNRKIYRFMNRRNNTQEVSFQFAEYPESIEKINALSDGDSLIISGYYNGNSTLQDVYIEAYGQDLEDVREADENWENQYNESRKSFIEESKSFPYKDICRNPKKYENEKLSFTGEVIQTNDAIFHQILLISTSYDGENIVYVEYKGEEYTDARILVGDEITVYGIFEKLTSYTTVLGTNNTVPYLEAIYTVNHSVD